LIGKVAKNAIMTMVNNNNGQSVPYRFQDLNYDIQRAFIVLHEPVGSLSISESADGANDVDVVNEVTNFASTGGASVGAQRGGTGDDSARTTSAPADSSSVGTAVSAPAASAVTPVPVGTKLRMWWEDDQEWYTGTVSESFPSSGALMRVSITYDDGDVETVQLQHERFEVVAMPTDAASVAAAAPFSAPTSAPAPPAVSRAVAQAAKEAGWGEGQELASEAANAIAAVSVVSTAIGAGGGGAALPLLRSRAVSGATQLSMPTAAAVLDMASSWAEGAASAVLAIVSPKKGKA
jgi:hypothetical protein